MEELSNKLSREVIKSPCAAAMTNKMLGSDFEDSVGEEEVEVFYENTKDILLKHGLDITKKVKVLEIGSGNAILLNYFRNKGVDAVGVDARPRGGGTSQVLARIEQLPFKDNQFDVVLSFGSVFDDSIYAQDQNMMMEEINRVLKSGGFYLDSGFGKKKFKPIVDFTLISPKSENFRYLYKKS